MKKAAGNRRPLHSRIPGCLFRRLLPRRIERAGIVDFGDLVIAEAEDLALCLLRCQLCGPKAVEPPKSIPVVTDF
ncbi:hypothetical protein V1290_006474 [Bradyrhizobium sp. AZCC 1578]|uniref:hypothetical protein n=1 Tax=unclassified Bradyrhizobium TaxID=2631580 RepID=UPI002FF3D63C